MDRKSLSELHFGRQMGAGAVPTQAAKRSARPLCIPRRSDLHPHALDYVHSPCRPARRSLTGGKSRRGGRELRSRCLLRVFCVKLCARTHIFGDPSSAPPECAHPRSSCTRQGFARWYVLHTPHPSRTFPSPRCSPVCTPAGTRQLPQALLDEPFTSAHVSKLYSHEHDEVSSGSRAMLRGKVSFARDSRRRVARFRRRTTGAPRTAAHPRSK